jgi:hypothetical protein
MAAEICENLNERLLDLLLDDTCKNLREGVQRAPEPLHVDAASVFEKVCSVLRGSHRRAGHFDNGVADYTVASLVVWG